MAAEPMRKYEGSEAGYSEKVIDPRLVSERFLGKERFSPSEDRPARKKRHRSNNVYATDPTSKSVADDSDITSLFSFLEEQIRFIREQGAREAAKTLAKNLAQLALFLGMKPWLYSISLKICFWQGVFGVISLFFICLQASVDQILPEALTRIFGALLEAVGIAASSPFGTIGLVFWGIAFIVGICAFTCFTIFFYLTGVHIMRNIVASIIFFGCLALTILPGSNIFPWLLIWIWYVIRTETSFFRIGFEQFKSVHSMHKVVATMEKIFRASI